MILKDNFKMQDSMHHKLLLLPNQDHHHRVHHHQDHHHQVQVDHQYLLEQMDSHHQSLLVQMQDRHHRVLHLLGRQDLLHQHQWVVLPQHLQEGHLHQDHQNHLELQWHHQDLHQQHLWVDYHHLHQDLGVHLDYHLLRVHRLVHRLLLQELQV